ncbi:hypothetical protein ACKKBG_A28455 [Auxenochlorella protothecoides x Auxenochlorella symbiontica]
MKRALSYASTLFCGNGAKRAFAAATSIASETCAFANDGPYGVAPMTASVPVPGSTLSPLPVRVTIPQGPVQPSPILYLFNGFRMTSSYYKAYAQRAASWGYLVVQYDTPFFSLPTVVQEMDVHPALHAWVEAQGKAASGLLSGRVAAGTCATAGHSRGGKLATLLYLQHRAYIKACFLIDPVDGSSQSPASDPSAAAALAAAGAAVGMSSAGRIGSCNPRASGSLAFWAAAGPGSWNSVLSNANHACFAQAGWLMNHAFDLLCGRSGLGREAAQQLATVPMLTWLWDSLSQGAGAAVILPPTTESPDPGFKEWYAAQVESGLVKPLEVKTPSSKPVAPPEEQVVRAPQRMPLPA